MRQTFFKNIAGVPLKDIGFCEQLDDPEPAKTIKTDATEPTTVLHGVAH